MSTTRKRQKDVEQPAPAEDDDPHFNELLTALIEVTNELSMADSFDILCRRAVELGRERLGFDRLGLWFLGDDAASAYGSFGTDAHGNIRDERGATLKGWIAEYESFRSQDTAYKHLPEHDLFEFEDGEFIGRAESTYAPLSEGERIVGFISSDNLLTHRPYTEQRNRLLVLYASVLGHLCARKRFEDRLSESEERYRRLVDNVDLGITHIDADYTIVATNKAHSRFYDKQVEAQVGKKCHVEFEGRDAPCANCTGTRAMASGQPIEVVAGPGRRTDGTEFFARIKAIPVFAESGQVTGFVEIAEDITERRQNEAEREKLAAQLRQAQKMEAVGQLAGGVAHDFNNLLQAIQGYTELAMGQIPAEHLAHADLTQVYKATARAATLIRQLLAFSRREVTAPEPLDLAAAVGGLLKMLRRVIGEHVELRTSHAPGLKRVYVDPGQIEQVLVNLCVNARDAMPRGGTITIGTRNALRDEVLLAEHPMATEREYGVLTVSDTGEGILPEHLDHIFEPFFTTKERGHGTGLGLATVYGIVTHHDGFLQVDSQPGKGTCFSVYLPVREHGADVAAARKAQEPAHGGTETVLLAEDDDFVRDIGLRVLDSAGYRTLVARDGEEALALFDQHAEDIDLALLDVIMPKKSGRLVHDTIIARKPGMRVLFCTGYTFEELDPDALPHERGYHLIHKPYTSQDLLHKIREVLAAPEY